MYSKMKYATGIQTKYFISNSIFNLSLLCYCINPTTELMSSFELVNPYVVI